RHANGSAKAQILFSGVVPGTAMHGLPAEPGGVVRRRFKATAATAVIGCARIPVTIAGSWTAVHRGPTVQVRRIAQTDIVGGIRCKIIGEVQQSPAPFLRHVSHYVVVA